MPNKAINLEIGNTVKLRPDVVRLDVPEGREDNRTARIKAFLSDIPGGLYLDRDLHGCKYWNVEHVERVPN